MGRSTIWAGWLLLMGVVLGGAPACENEDDSNILTCETLADCPEGFFSCINGVCSRDGSHLADGDLPPTVEIGRAHV